MRARSDGRTALAFISLTAEGNYMQQRRINVRAIIWHEGKLLAVKHKESDGSEAAYWATPGGGLDPMESLIDGIKREIQEETGKTAVVGNLLFMQQFASGQRAKEELEFFYHVTNGKDFLDIDLSKTTHGEEELARIEFIDPRKENILPAFLSEIDIEKQIAENGPPTLFSEL